MRIVSVDGGTTNTRLTLVEDGTVLSTVKIKIGAGEQSGNAAENPYWTPLREGLHALLTQQRLTITDVDAMLYSGMIGSETGLYTVPHLSAPANAKRVADALVAVSIPQIADLPMLFVPGVRTEGAVSDIDIMRGEETELFGICHAIGETNFVAVMPGSHTKIVRMEQNGTIAAFRTAMTGELIRATAEHTILRHALCGVFPRQLDLVYLEKGFAFCNAHGINQALFEVRILQKFAEQTPEQLYAFLCGVCLQGDIRPILETAGNAPIYVGGSNPFRTAYTHLLRQHGGVQVYELSDDLAEHAAAYGAQLLAELHRGRECIKASRSS